MAAVDVLVEVDQVGAPSKGGDGRVCVVIPVEKRQAKWAEIAALFPDNSEPRRKVQQGAPLFASLMALPIKPKLYRQPTSGITFAWATNRQYWEASLLSSGFMAEQTWRDVCDAWTPALRDRMLDHERAGHPEFAFDEAIEQSGLAYALGTDERGDKRRVDGWQWGSGEKSRFLPLWVDGVKLDDMAPVVNEVTGERVTPVVTLDLSRLGFGAKTMGEIRNPAFEFAPRRNYTLDWSNNVSRAVPTVKVA